MRIIARMRRKLRVAEEAIVEEGAFEDEVDEGVKEVPDVEDTQFGAGGSGEEADGGKVGGKENDKGCKEGENGYGGEEGGWLRGELGFDGHDWSIQLDRRSRGKWDCGGSRTRKIDGEKRREEGSIVGFLKLMLAARLELLPGIPSYGVKICQCT